MHATNQQNLDALKTDYIIKYQIQLTIHVGDHHWRYESQSTHKFPVRIHHWQL